MSVGSGTSGAVSHDAGSVWQHSGAGTVGSAIGHGVLRDWLTDKAEQPRVRQSTTVPVV